MNVGARQAAVKASQWDNESIPKMKLQKTTRTPRGKSAEKPAVVAAASELTMAAANPTTLLAEVRALTLATRQTVAQASIPRWSCSTGKSASASGWTS